MIDFLIPDLERDHMKSVPYAPIISSLIYVMVKMWLDITRMRLTSLVDLCTISAVHIGTHVAKHMLKYLVRYHDKLLDTRFGEGSYEVGTYASIIGSLILYVMVMT
jgi:hypothetical protein